MNQIKIRLKTAYENVEFHGSNTWNNDFSTYQKANQELFVREKKVQDALSEELLRPRTVRDCIPNSRLAKYANYEYTESRELCYASSANNVSFYYPCIFNKSSPIEPWMLPEVEQLFIWFTHTPKFNILEFLQMEEINEMDKDLCNSIHRCRDFHEISSLIYDIFEKTPGKSRYKKSTPLTQSDILRFVPSQFKIETFEDMVLRMKIRSEKVKYLWSQQMKSQWKDPDSKKVTLFKTPLGNYFVTNIEGDGSSKEEKKPAKKSLVVTDFQFRKSDCLQLQTLLNSIQYVENLFLKAANHLNPNVIIRQKKEAVSPSKSSEPTPTRRLYSAVLQGSSRDLKKEVTIDSILPSICFSKISPVSSVLNNSSSSCLSTSSSFSILGPTFKSTPVLQDSRVPKSTSSPSWEAFQPKNSQTVDCAFKHSIKPLCKPKSENWVTKSRDRPSSSFNLEPCADYNFNESTVPLESPYCNYNSNSNVCFSNMYGSNSFFNNSCYNSQYASNSQQPNQGLSMNYRNVCIQYVPPVHISLPNSVWCIQNNKPPPNYNLTHYTTHPYVFLPTPISHTRPMQEYSPQSSTRCIRTTAPNNPSTCHLPIQCSSYNNSSAPQYCGGVNSTHKMPYLCSENQHNFVAQRKFADCKVESNFPQNRSWFHERPETSKTYSGDHVKQSSSAPILDYQNKNSLKGDIKKGSSTVTFKNTIQLYESNSQESFGSHRTTSEELEMLAIMQYEASRDDLEKQAEEQYSSENWMSPPCNILNFGGLFKHIIAICAV